MHFLYVGFFLADLDDLLRHTEGKRTSLSITALYTYRSIHPLNKCLAERKSNTGAFFSMIDLLIQLTVHQKQFADIFLTDPLTCIFDCINKIYKSILHLSTSNCNVDLPGFCVFYPHHLKLKNPRQELAFVGAGLLGIVMYYMLENTALTMTYASNVGIIVACAPFLVAVIVGIFFKNEKSGIYFYIGFVVAIAGVILISLNGQKNFQLNPMGDGLAFIAMISWGCYSTLIKKIGEWDYPTVAATRRIYFYGILFLIPVLIQQKASWKPELMMKPEVLSNFLFLGLFASAVVLSMLVLHEKMTVVSVIGSALIFVGLVISQKRRATGDGV